MAASTKASAQHETKPEIIDISKAMEMRRIKGGRPPGLKVSYSVAGFVNLDDERR